MAIYSRTTATEKICALDSRIRAVAGGTSASKTISILFWLIDRAIAWPKSGGSPELISIVSESYPHLEKGAMTDFENIMKDAGYWDDSCWNKTKHTYTFPGGSKMEFFSVDTYGKAHGPRRDILYINECNNLEYKIVDQLITRTRKIVWLDWNPSSEFWFYTDMLPHRNDVQFITLTYKDNEALDPITVSEIESHKHNKAWWRVYGEGQLGEVEGRIFTGWATIDEIPHEARLERRGLDFGYSNDPTVLVDIYYYNGGYIVDEVVYMKGLHNKDIADRILSQPSPQTLVVADSAELKSIDEIASFGINIIGVEKRPGYVRRNSENSLIDWVQTQRMTITKRSLNVIKSYRSFMWQTDKDGNILNEYDHYFSDGMMATIYGLSNFQPRAESTETYTTGNFAEAWM